MKIIAPPFPTGSVVFCDDIRLEIGNKASLIGVYTGEMLLSPDTKFPITLPKLGMVVFWNEPVKDCASSVTFVASLVSANAKAEEVGQVLAESSYEIPKEGIEKTAASAERTGVVMSNSITALLMVSPLQISGPCKIRMRAIRADEERMIGAIRIDLEQS